MRILVIGEKCLDRFVYLNVHRLSPEAPVPDGTIHHIEENDGMAGNVLNNIRSLIYYKSMIDFVHQETVINKIRYKDYVSNQHIFRYSENDRCERIDLSKVDLDSYSAVVVSDYNKGFLTELDLYEIGRRAKLSFIDTKKQFGLWSEHYDFIKINKKEYDAQKEKDLDNLIVTLGKDGAMYRNKIYKYQESDVKDQAGLGDTFLAGFVVEYLFTKDVNKAIDFANKASYCAALKRGVATVSYSEVNQL